MYVCVSVCECMCVCVCVRRIVRMYCVHIVRMYMYMCS